MRIELSGEFVAWIEEVAQGRVVSAARHFAGASREAWSVDVTLPGTTPGKGPGPAEVRPLFLMRDRGQGGGSARDAHVLRALANSGVPVPAVVGFDDERATLLLSRLPGRSDFPEMEDLTEKESVAAHLMELTSALHALDIAALDIPHLSLPTKADESARLAIEQARAAQTALGEKADPFFAFALGWLEANVPAGMSADALVHSDMGPGNFLFQDGRVTGIVDWEVAHFGDAMEDLAAIAVRDMATPVGDLGKRFAEYEAASGASVDISRVHYFRLLILVRNSLMIGLGLAHPAEGFDVIEMTMYQTLLARAATLVLCDNLAVARPIA
ncbi:MAG: phosphotransferase family protein, partial [Myxococcota bacterium]